jgi:simple sugar transport system ATP-binding protein
VISQDLDEIFALADRIAVIAEGRLSQTIPIAEASIERIGLLMGGTHGTPPGSPGGPHAASA